MSTALPPPQHPATAPAKTTTTAVAPGDRPADKVAARQEASSQQASVNAAGNSLAQGVKGAWNVFHGAGEAIRGNILQGVDNSGSNPNTTTATTGASTGPVGTASVEPTTGGSVGKPAGGHVAESGFAEVNRGLQKLEQR